VNRGGSRERVGRQEGGAGKEIPHLVLKSGNCVTTPLQYKLAVFDLEKKLGKIKKY
jgi:hypothetical protein